MLFNSYIFILFFLPLCVGGYFAFNHFGKYTLGQAFLLAMSLWFYGFYNPSYLAVIAASVLINYGVYLFIRRTDSRRMRKAAMIGGVAVNIGILVYFKYMDFLISNINAVFGKDIGMLRIALPLGISFFTFQQISFLVDAYRGEIPGYDFLSYASFVCFFPQLVAGPIVTHDELVPQFADPDRKRPNSDNLARGIYLFSIGLAKKVLLADTFGKLVSHGFGMTDSLDTATAVITMLSYTFQIYFDFSGYCDMAAGIGRMINIELPRNFDSPYKARTITEFWDRWHMTLTRFFTKYVYIPLGGNRKGRLRTYVNVMIVFLLSGLWHGASWNFVFWGGIHGLFVVVTRMFRRFFERLHPVVNWLLTFSFVNVSWVFFRAESFSQAVALLRRIAALDFGGFDPGIYELVRSAELTEILEIFPIETIFPPFVPVMLFGLAFLMLSRRNAQEKMLAFKPSVLNMGTTLILLLWSVFSLTEMSTFLYFNF